MNTINFVPKCLVIVLFCVKLASAFHFISLSKSTHKFNRLGYAGHNPLKSLSRRPHRPLYYSSDEDDKNNKNDEDEDSRRRRHMRVVRSLQVSFYQDSLSWTTAQASTRLDLSTGRVDYLMLWRVSWMELPGRTNVLNVHDPVYTNLFETILHSAPPWYVGHVYLPGGGNPKKKVKSYDKTKDNQWLALQNWKQRADLINTSGASKSDKKKNEVSSVLGTLLKIADYRRMEDGRLLLLVQAIERFVITEVVQELPYAKAHVQLLPDIEEVDDNEDWIHTRTETEVAPARALAVAESFARWHRYEYENTMLPLPLQSDLPADQVIGSALAKVLPYAPYSSVVNVERLAQEHLEVNGDKEKGKDLKTLSGKENKDASLSLSNVSSQPTLECQLERSKIVNNISFQPALATPYLKLSLDELEIRFWIALNEFLKRTRTPVSPILLGLLPHRTDNNTWPTDFVLEKIANAIEEQTYLDHKYVRVSPAYPSIRRQRD